MPTIALLAAAVLAAQAPQETPPDREELRRQLISLTHSGCGFEAPERRKRLVQIAMPALKELPLMIKEAEGEKLQSLLSLYWRLVKLKHPT